MHKLFQNKQTSNQSLNSEFMHSNHTVLMPIASIAGGFSAQEVLKACTSKFAPLDQFYYFHCEGLFKGCNSNCCNIGCMKDNLNTNTSNCCMDKNDCNICCMESNDCCMKNNVLYENDV